jgi:hypothetical protein
MRIGGLFGVDSSARTNSAHRKERSVEPYLHGRLLRPAGQVADTPVDVAGGFGRADQAVMVFVRRAERLQEGLGEGAILPTRILT